MARAGCKAAVAIALTAGTAVSGEPLRLLAYGDSLTAGYGLPQGEGFVPQLDAWLAEHSDREVEVLNMGVSGDTTSGGLARLEWSLADGGDAMILALGGNDLLRGIDPDLSRSNLDKMLATLSARGIPVILSGLMAPTNYGPDYKEAFDTMYPDLAEKYGALYDPFFLEGVGGRPGMNQPDGIHPSAEGVAVMVARIGPLVLALLDRVEPSG